MSPHSVMNFPLRKAATLVVALFLASCGAQAQDNTVAPPPPAVTTAPVLTQALRPWDEFTGRLEAIDTVQVRPRVGGFIMSVGFREGAAVRKGEVLFRIDPRPFQSEVDRLTAEVAANRA